MKKWIWIPLIGLITGGYMALRTPVIYEDTWMDSPLTRDISLENPDHILSQRYPNPTPEILQRPVIIACHGYTASTFEWLELKTFAESRSDVLVSLVPLGGHGRDVHRFAESSWEDWGQPILDEYNALIKKGYRNINFIGSSAGALLLAHYLASGAFSDHPPGSIVLVDPFLIPQRKELSLIPYLGWLIGNIPASETRNPVMRRHWYNNHPVATLKELHELIQTVATEIEVGLPLPATTLVIYQSSGDRVSDPDGAWQLARKFYYNDGKPVQLNIIHSPHHVFTHGLARDEGAWTSADRQIQEQTFRDIIRLTQHPRAPDTAK